VNAHPLPAHVRTIRIEALEAPGAEAAPAPQLLRVHGVLEDRRPRGVPDWLQHEPVGGRREVGLDATGDGHRRDPNVIHHMEVTLTVRHPESVIAAVEGRMVTFPHAGLCPEVLPGLQSLVGVSVGRGFTRAVNQRLGRERGCTHVAALILAMGPVVRQGAGAAFGLARPRTSEERPWFINSCHAWREGGPLHQWLLGPLAGRE
jgi:hypothetical protein